MLVSIAVSADLPYLGVFQRFLRCYLPVEYRLVPAGLQYGCSKLPSASFTVADPPCGIRHAQSSPEPLRD